VQCFVMYETHNYLYCSGVGSMQTELEIQLEF